MANATTVRMDAVADAAASSARAGRRPARLPGSLLPARIEAALRALEDSATSNGDPASALRDTVEALWRIVQQAASERALNPSRHRHSVRALLARRELVRRGTCILSAIIRRGADSRTFHPDCAPWAIERLPFAIVAGACVHWVFGLAKRPSLRAGTAVEAALELLRPYHQSQERSGGDNDERQEAHVGARRPDGSFRP